LGSGLQHQKSKIKTNIAIHIGNQILKTKNDTGRINMPFLLLIVGREVAHSLAIFDDPVALVVATACASGLLPLLHVLPPLLLGLSRQPHLPGSS
jgi:hypothetical protein